MPVVLLRVDERLIHGQVVVGWGARLHPDRIVVVDDDLATSEWEQDLYRIGVPAAVEAGFVDVEQAHHLLAQWDAEPQRTILLIRDVKTLQRLAERSGLAGIEVNLGGIHHAPGRERLLPYLHLSAEEREILRDLAARGAAISARDVPSSRPVDLKELLDGRGV